MSKLLQAIWPRSEHLMPADIAALQQEGRELDARIMGLQGLSDTETSLYLDAARRIADEEDRRKTGAEGRATTFIAAVAALIPLMTWAIGNAAPPATCAPGWGCLAWTGVFALAVVYFITAAYWALRTLAVANYHVIGVEDVVLAKEHKKNIHKALVQQTLLQARRNRDTINLKLTFIKVAQQRFFNGLFVLGLLLMLDPATRFGLLDAGRKRMATWVSRPAEVSRGQVSHTQSREALLQKSDAPGLPKPNEQMPANPQQRP